MLKSIISVLLICFISSLSYSFEIPENKRVDYWVKEFSHSRRQFFQSSIIRSGLYRPTIKAIFKKEGVPASLSWLPLIESGFNCSAVSNMKAAGCWQFIKRTGKAYGLKSGKWEDRRYDFTESTIAAAKYLKRLYKRFGKWDLALAAYNCGPTKVRKAIKKSRETDYWMLDLPGETTNYLPQFYAVLKITRDLEKYGFENAGESIIIVQLKSGSHSLRYIAKILSVDYDDFERINPGYQIGYTHPKKSANIYLMKDWDISLLKGFGLLAKKNQLRIN